MKKILKILLYLFLGLLSLIVILVLVYNLYFGILNSSAKSGLTEKPQLEVDGFSFRDLNNNGKLDVYEDSRQLAENRVEDLLSQMTLEQKAGQMWHPPIGVGQNGEVLKKPGFKSMNPSSTYDVLIKKKIRHFNLFLVPKSRQLAEWYNEIQKIAEQDELGIPVTISSDPRHGIINFMGSDFLDSDFSKWPEPIGLAAIRDSMLTVTFGQIANREYRSVGIRTALHPMADLATEPRWARINGTFGEDANLSAKITAAYIYGFQGDTLGPSSVACMAKHWPGGGPQADGEDAHFHYGSDQAYPGNNFKYHLIPFEAAFQAGTAMIMPYYGVAVGQTSEDVGMSFNKEIITDLLRKQYNYNGVICTDWGIVEGLSFLGFEIVEAKNWGVQNLTVKERVKKVIDAGVDQFGGNVNIKELIELIKEGQISEFRIDESVRRLLKAKFVMGLFDNPYVDPGMAEKTVGKKEYMEQGKLAQRRSIVLLKNKINPDSSMVLPLDHSVKIYVENISKSVAENYATVVDSLDYADFAILRLQAPWEPRHGDFVERFFHQGDLDFKEPEHSRILAILQQKPTVVCIYLDRPAVIPEIADASAGLLAEFGAHDDAVLDIIFGNFNPGAKLPFELPSSMEAVKTQYEDVPYDSKNPLFPFGHGLRYEEDETQCPTTF